MDCRLFLPSIEDGAKRILALSPVGLLLVNNRNIHETHSNVLEKILFKMIITDEKVSIIPTNFCRRIFYPKICLKLLSPHLHSMFDTP